MLPAFPAFAAAPAEAPTIPTILIVGDSLSAGYGLRPGEGWVSLLEQRLGSEGYPHRVVNASISGDTTRGALSRLPRALEVHDPEIVVIELGGNDGLRGFPVDVMRGNLAEIVRLSRESGADVLLLGMRIPANYGPAYTERFYRVFVDLAESAQVPFLPFFLDGVALKPELMQDDGIHPNADAQATLLNNVWPALAPLLGRAMPAETREAAAAG
ncbi:MAG TPA: arylesterase [Gammaproteobacteria bacterium]